MEKSVEAQIEQIRSKIYFIRGHRVMFDSDLSELYGVDTKVLNQAVRRNLERFPPDFMIQLTVIEAQFSRSPIVTLNDVRQGKNLKYLPFAFTEQGVAIVFEAIRQIMEGELPNQHRKIKAPSE